MKLESRRQPYDARKFNLLGLGQLGQNPSDAANSFKSALRCDLHYGPAYLNLAQAYQNTNNPAAAAQCLQRYLQLFPAGPLARDAQRRLGALLNTPPAGAGAPQGVPGGAP